VISSLLIFLLLLFCQVVEYRTQHLFYQTVQIVNFDQGQTGNTVLLSPADYRQFIAGFDAGFFTQVLGQHHLPPFVDTDYRLDLAARLVF
jgi:hypothetical protein